MTKMMKPVFFLVYLLAAIAAIAQGKYPYTEVEGDPYKARIYKLNNGLTVMLSVNKSAPQIHTMIAVKAGSKHDPADNTGLAHYLEHMLFKGSESFGTKSYAAEMPYLSKIEAMYNLYGKTTDSTMRAKIYREIDSLSLEASKIGIANEYDRMMQFLGATGTNAFTANDQTVYINAIPSNQLEKWLKIEFDRFYKPVFRIFHTELEAVYEEKNRTLDNDNSKAFEALFAGAFPAHPYGTQTTIGTVEHLKNPSLSKIREYFNNYYKADNMALIMSGDFNPDEAIVMIDKTLGHLPMGAQIKFQDIPENRDPMGLLTTETVKYVTGPQEEKVYMGFRTKGAKTNDALLLYMTDMILANSQAGMLDINLNKAQKVQYASCSPHYMRDYSLHYFVIYPKEGQTLEEARALVMEELEKLKRGEFDESIMPAIVENLRLSRATNFNNNEARCSDMMESFVFGTSWKNHIDLAERLEKLTKNDITEFAKTMYSPGKQTTVYKLMGKDTTIEKIPKPVITPIEVNREVQSIFARQLYAEPTTPQAAQFPDLETAVVTSEHKKGKTDVTLSYVPNAETDYFTLYINFEMGKSGDEWLEPVSNYIPYLATTTISNEAISRQFFNLACNFGYVVEEGRSYIYLKGLNKNFDKAYALLKQVFTDAKVEESTWQNLVSDILKNREDNKTNKNIILRSALKNYVRYGKENPFTDIVSAQELKAAKAEDISKKINSLLTYNYEVWYFGPEAKVSLETKINDLLNPSKKLQKTPKPEKFKPQEHKTTTVYFVPFDMVQAEVWWDRQLKTYKNDKLPSISIYNEYFGMGMYSLVFQTIRESKALAYSSFATVGSAPKKDDPAFVVAYVGTQADKLVSAMQGMHELMNNLPTDKFIAQLPAQSIKKQIEADRIFGENLLFEKYRSEKMGIKQPVNKLVYDNIDKVTFENLVALQKEAYQNQPFAICIIASKDRVNLNDLKTFGEVKELTLEEIFGY